MSDIPPTGSDLANRMDLQHPSPPTSRPSLESIILSDNLPAYERKKLTDIYLTMTKRPDSISNLTKMTASLSMVNGKARDAIIDSEKDAKASIAALEPDETKTQQFQIVMNFMHGDSVLRWMVLSGLSEFFRKYDKERTRQITVLEKGIENLKSGQQELEGKFESLKFHIECKADVIAMHDHIERFDAEQIEERDELMIQLENRCADYSKTITDLHRLIPTLYERIEDERKRVNEYKLIVGQLQSSGDENKIIKDLQNIVDSLHKSLGSHDKNMADWLLRNSDDHVAKASLHNVNADLRKSLAERKSTIEDLECDLRGYKEDEASREERLSTWFKENKDYEDQNRKLTAEVHELRKSKIDDSKRIIELENKLKMVEAIAGSKEIKIANTE